MLPDVTPGLALSQSCNESPSTLVMSLHEEICKATSTSGTA